MSYRLIDANAIAESYTEVHDMPCIYADLPRGLDGGHYDMRGIDELQADNAKLFALLKHESEQTEKLRELCKDWRRFAYDLFDDFVGEPEANDDFMALDDRTHEQGVGVE